MKPMLDWKVTSAVVLALGMEAAGLLMWAGATTQRLEELEGRVAQQAELAERMTRVEVQLQIATTQLDRIEKKLGAN